MTYHYILSQVHFCLLNTSSNYPGLFPPRGFISLTSSDFVKLSVRHNLTDLFLCLSKTQSLPYEEMRRTIPHGRCQYTGSGFLRFQVSKLDHSASVDLFADQSFPRLGSPIFAFGHCHLISKSHHQ